MATTIKLEGEARSEFGKGVARRLRVANKIPATIYAGGEEPAFVTLPMRETTLALRHTNALFTIAFDGNTKMAVVKDVQCVKVRQSSNSDKGYDNPQVMLMRTKKGCFIDVEVQVADGYGYDIQCEVVCENGTVKLPDPYAVVCRSRPAGWDSVKPAESMPIMTDWKERFIEAYDIEFCKWVESVHAGKLTGPSSWDGYVACVAGDALNASRGTSQFLKVETMEKPEMYK